MPIFANINNRNAAITRFMCIAEDNTTYSTFLNANFNTGVSAGGSDHFISSMKDIDKVTQKFKGNAPIPSIMLDIQNNPNLYRWFNAVLCAFIYGFEGENNLEIKNVPFNSPNPAGTYVPIPQKKYLEIWKNKFFDVVANDNHKNTPPDNDDINGINILSFGNGYENMLGCFSKKYFVIPMKEMDLSAQTVPEWKVKFNDLCRNAHNLGNLNDLLNIRQKILVMLSAMSIKQLPGAPDSLRLVEAIISHYISIPQTVLNPVALPVYAVIDNINFYKIIDDINLDNLISDTVSIVAVGKGEYYSLYPFTESIINNITSGVCQIKNLSFFATQDPEDPNTVSNVKISFDYNADFHFIAAPSANNNIPGVQKFIYNVERVYPKNKIVSITELNTICMFPNLPLAYENQCSKFTYLKCEEATILGRSLSGINSVDLSSGYFMGKVNANQNRNIILNRADAANYRHITTTVNGITRNINTHDLPVPEHFIEVCSNIGTCYGYIVNIYHVPSMLGSSKPAFDIDLSITPVPAGDKMNYYVDFGSSSSRMQYSIGDGDLQTTLIKENCSIRPLLAEYAQNDYKYIINDFNFEKRLNFLSISTTYDVPAITDYAIYKQSWLPIEKSCGDYIKAGVKISPSFKTDLSKPACTANSPKIIIYNMCYIMACNAVAQGVPNLYIIPSLPSSDYIDNLKLIWNEAIASINKMFPHLNIYNTLDTRDEQCLYESVAISNGENAPGVDTLSINIDIGDGTTDMSAMMIDQLNKKHMCGYSSIEYAGKNLVKTTIKDIMENGAMETVQKLFKGGAGFGTGIFNPSSNDLKAEYDYQVDNLIRLFFDGDTRRKTPNEQWENVVLDMLNVSNMSRDIDPKIAMNFMLRYIILMPVIKDFITTSIKLAGDNFVKQQSNIKISFFGGSSKGINVLEIIDSRRSGNVRENIDKYFIEGLKEYSYSVTVEVPQVDGKETLIKGLHSLQVTPNNGLYELAPRSNDNVEVINWDEINPNKQTYFGQPNNVHCGFGKFKFISLDEVNGDTAKARSHNKAQLTNPNSYYDDLANPLEDFKTYFNDEIFGKIIDNNDGNPDLLETIIKDFINNASPQMQNYIKQELLGGKNNNSFIKATNSSVYPEMIKNTIFMFAVSDILSKYHGPMRNDHIIKDDRDIPGYQFGG